ncbi:hypothetical protein MRX96_054122, partial [Rhipicephalus microplus]
GPKIQPFSFPNDAQLGKEAAVSCFAVRGRQPLKSSWLKNGERVDSASNVEVEEIAAKISTPDPEGSFSRGDRELHLPRLKRRRNR